MAQLRFRYNVILKGVKIYTVILKVIWGELIADLGAFCWMKICIEDGVYGDEPLELTGHLVDLNGLKVKEELVNVLPVYKWGEKVFI